MMSGRIGAQIGAVIVIFGMLLGVEGCSEKRTSSISGDQSMPIKGKADQETVRQEPMAAMDTPFPNGGTPSPGIRDSQLTPSVPGSSSVPSSSSIPSSSAVPGSKGSTSSPDPTGVGDIYFDFDRYHIRKDAQPVLEGNARWLRIETGKSVVIEGHCDERGTLAYNLVLGEKRARSAKHFLEDLGVPASRIQTTSYGEVKPFCKEHNEGCWQQNRRAHFVVH